MQVKKAVLLGEMLVREKIITPLQLDKALAEQKKSGELLGRTLVKMGFARQEEILSALSRQLDIEYVKLKDISIELSLIEKIPANFVSHYKFMPIELNDSLLKIAVSNPLDFCVLDDLKLILGYKIKPVLAEEKDILETIREYYGIGAETVERIIADTSNTKIEFNRLAEKTEDIETVSGDASIIKFVNQIMIQAYRDRATDIHIEPYEDELRIRYRIDGILYDIPVPASIKHFQSAIVSRIKIMAKLNIAERRLPQDGRIKGKIEGNDLDFRVSILPTPYGESVDIRLLSTNIFLGLEHLGLLPQDLTIMESMIRKPHGIIFVTGPTGSGKTTTLYACLSKINSSEKKIITIEDPIEYQLKGITQIQISTKIGLTFAKGLRSMLRHDPDIMMVGEVRDYETAEITIRIALTGHLIFSTLHTNDATSAITRLIDMGIEPFLISSSVECFIAQRLVRVTCPHCKREINPRKEYIEQLFKDTKELNTTRFFEGRGCENCKFSGYKGRTAIYEILVVNEQIKELILAKASADEIRRKAISLGMRTLRQDGWIKISKGLTTPSEVLRVTQEESVE